MKCIISLTPAQRYQYVNFYRTNVIVIDFYRTNVTAINSYRTNALEQFSYHSIVLKVMTHGMFILVRNRKN